VLGGVGFPGETGLQGHSDADVLVHAVIDALLGAAALGDIGSRFPDTSERWRGADSVEMLVSTVRELESAGYAVVNIDATVICERPKLRDKVDSIRRRLSEAVGIPFTSVSVKGKTNEKMDDVGSGVGIAVHAVALIEKN
jgi:2-C-methyl-D-erythritol 2,4-cyclodiphosphate synthase